MYNIARFVLEIGSVEPKLNELGLNQTGKMFYMNESSLNNQYTKGSRVLVPRLVDAETGTTQIAGPELFSPPQLYAILNRKIEDKSVVSYMADTDGTPILTRERKLQLAPYKSRRYTRNFLIDTLEAFGTHLRINKNKEVDVEEWFKNYEHTRHRKINAEDYDEGEIPQKLKQGVA